MDEKKQGTDEYAVSEETVADDVVVDMTDLMESADDELNLHVHKKPPQDHHVNEIREFRGKNSKVFRMDDGSQQAVFYAKPTHAFDETTGEYELLDHTLTEDENGNYHNRNDRFVAKFNSDEDSDEVFSIEAEDHQVSVCYVLMNKQGKKAAHKMKLADEVVRFAASDDGVNIDYFVTDDGVKENIIVDQKSDSYRYIFELRCENVRAQLDEAEQRVAFTDVNTDEEVFHIPAPFMTDAEGALSTDVTYDLQQLENGHVRLVVEANADWVNAEDRVFPVTIDPQIMVTNNGGIVTHCWHNGEMFKTASYWLGTRVVDGTHHRYRMYLNVNMPTLPNNPRIKKAELVLKAQNGTGAITSEEMQRIGLYQVTGDIAVGTCTPTENSQLVDFEKMRVSTSEESNQVNYTFDITKMIDVANKTGEDSVKLVLKSMDETATGDNYVCFLGDDVASSIAPQLCITYETSYGVNTAYRTHTHKLGRFGQGSVDLQCGNLMFESVDFNWSGRRKPVMIKHLYTSALSGQQYTANDIIGLKTADFSGMKLGYGWKLNLMQSMVPTTFQHEGVQYTGYVYIDENGREVYFKEGTQRNCTSEEACYLLHEDVETGSLIYDSYKHALFVGEDRYEFDEEGHLIYITDSYGNQISITYMGSQIQSITDGAGRIFAFAYNSDGTLASITAPDDTKIEYLYYNLRLGLIKYPDGRRVIINYNGMKPSSVCLCDSNDVQQYRVEYTFNGDQVVSVKEYGMENSTAVLGVTNAYSYSAASRKTVVEKTEPKDDDETEDTVIQTVYTFDDEGNVISEYVSSDALGNAGVASGEGLLCNSGNYLCNHNFASLNHWNRVIADDTKFMAEAKSIEGSAKYGKTVLVMQSTDETVADNGAYQSCLLPSAGEYTFSAYVRVTSAFTGENQPGVCLKVTDATGNLLGQSEMLTTGDVEYVRLVVPFTVTEAQQVNVYATATGKGTAYVNAAQLEKNAYVNDYNMLSYEYCDDCFWSWRKSEDADVSFSVDGGFNDTAMIVMNGDLDKEMYAYHPVIVKSYRSTRETFTLSGWAKATGVVNRDREGLPNARFCLHATVFYDDVGYNDCGYETHTAEFSPCTDDWQYVSIQFAKQKYRKVSHVSVYCDYSYNDGVAYFDDIRLVRNRLETGLGVTDFSELDITTEMEMVEDSETVSNFEESSDQFGNKQTGTMFTDGEFGTFYRSLEYSDNGNDLIRETDERGNVTSYTVNTSDSRSTEVVDRCGKKSVYEYDENGRTIKTTNKTADNTLLADFSYEYDDFDNMIRMSRGDEMAYLFDYNSFHHLQAISVRGKMNPLVQYTYKNAKGRVKRIAYANGDLMNIVYDRTGCVIAEKWYDAEEQIFAHYKYGYDNQGNIARLIDICAAKEYTYVRENGNVVLAQESDIELGENEIVIGKTLVNSISYSYDKKGMLTRKRIMTLSGEERDIYYQALGENVAVHFETDGKTVLSHSKKDSFGRKVFEELQLGMGFVSRQFSYHVGEVTDKHVADGKLKSTPTTSLVSRIELSDGRMLSYEYDAEERITKIVDSVDGTTEYTYDVMGQVLTESVNGVLVNTMTYDNYGNILTKNGVAYAYGDTVWRDLLTGYGDGAISYDAQGNPTSYLGHTLEWEKGRQLKSFDGNTYTYSEKGIRTSKTVNGVKHIYILEDSRILQETYGGNVLVPYYDNENEICGIEYNGTPYFFQRNLQGDIIAIANKFGNVVARYSYDAWGVCTIVDDNPDYIAHNNPFRYRGYYYDFESGLYYLQSRYYDPTVGRFINADDVQYVVCNVGNLFAYCANNPVCCADNTGMLCRSIYKKSAVVTPRYSHWLPKFVLSYLPINIYTDDFRKQVLYDASFLGVGIEIAIATAYQTNASAVLGWMASTSRFEISVSSALSDHFSFAISPGINWTHMFLKFGLYYASKQYGIVHSLTVDISVSHLTTAVIVAACVAAPYLSTFLGTLVSAASASLASAATALTPMIPAFLNMLGMRCSA